MATETPAPTASRPRPWLLVLLAVSVIALAVARMFSGDSAAPSVPRSTPVPPVRQQNGVVDPSELNVKLEALTQPAPRADAAERNPFRFKPPPPPPPTPPPPSVKTAPPALPAPVVPVEPPGPPPPPPITIKFIGVVETARGKVGAFVDCGDPSGRNRATFAGREGEVVEGRYRVVRIGIESAIVEYRDGGGRTTLPLNGQAQACLQK